MAKKRKETFVFRIAWQEVLKDYPSEVRLEVYDAMIEYVASGTLPQLKPLANMAFSFIKRDIDADDARYAETVAKRAEAGRKGMKERWSSVDDNTYNKCNTSYQDITNVTRVTNITDNDYVYDNDLKEENKNKEENHAPAVCYRPEPTLEECYNELVSSEIWAEDVIREKMRLGISLNAQTLRQLLDIFFGELKCRGTPARDVRTTKEHFSNWLNSYHEKQRKNENNRTDRTTSKQDATEYAVQLLAGTRKSRREAVGTAVDKPF
jgi:hypothetical protein